ncbi:ethanolamine permease [Leptospira gomenensis]|uniref:Ethanolamine permease n=1 Tax=Leptospira gomenensis TaxID=2484974 RepID=A0A5F1Z2U7_9LEPT|nr:ethanolamine permease [Leptospira gomenensis]TGK32421.1 ethanolamine permease [Leptospira gomenensis]TGK34682.1 ethanolamine permease [Leptospira gomenensis]TGK51021.1 ethanolamine permease [Leptospira gomenensis]TGK68338.1 ethanolamine permease [Leptospira gomenensis]
MPALQKTLGAFHLWGISVGLVISGDYFGWNLGWAHANFWEFLTAVSIVAIFYSCFSLCFTELAAAIPHAGGPSAYARVALGPWGGWIAGFFTLVEFVLAPPAIASALGGYFHFLVPEVSVSVASNVFFLILIGINLLGIKQTARFELFVTLTAVLGLVFYFAAVFPGFEAAKIIGPGNTFHFLNLFPALPYAIWFFLAVEGVAMTAEEVKRPEKDIPLGYLSGIGTLVLLAFGVLFSTAGVVSVDEVARLDYPLSFTLGKLYGAETWIVRAFTGIGLFGLVASLLGIILGYSRQIYALSKEGYLPETLSRLTRKTKTPYYSILAGGIVGLTSLQFGDTGQLITLSAFGACGMYCVSMISFFRFKMKNRNRATTYQAPLYPVLPIVALVLGFVCFITVAVYNILSFLILAGGLLLSILIHKSRGGFRNEKLSESSLSAETKEGILARGDTDF